MKIAGLSVVGTLLATILYYFFEFAWYSFFQEPWQQGLGIVPEDYGQSNNWMPLGVIAPLLQVIAIGLVLKWSGWPSMTEAVSKIFVLSVLLATAVGWYALVYMPQHSIPLFFVDTMHYLVGWLMTAVVLTYFRPRYVAPVTRRDSASDENIEDIYQ